MTWTSIMDHLPADIQQTIASPTADSFLPVVGRILILRAAMLPHSQQHHLPVAVEEIVLDWQPII
ncbi:hypothetical protein N7520_007871 [Penicillium odoratum]|uniref:uncharacterized protein n=1 Tax=Penicillium odoratum TaxID=1167516 RepID=UPI0025484980|nr:uncharacterized protein N7520_007871 [Penicillium odoratum]KAJ5760715.1 hypothetical protein N7520_007871 [Penicillium odoratum]